MHPGPSSHGQTIKPSQQRENSCVAGIVCARDSLWIQKQIVYCCRRRKAVNNQRVERNTSDSQRHGSRVSEPSPLRCLTANGKRPRASAGIELCHSIPRSSTHLFLRIFPPEQSSTRLSRSHFCSDTNTQRAFLNRRPSAGGKEHRASYTPFVGLLDPPPPPVSPVTITGMSLRKYASTINECCIH